MALENLINWLALLIGVVLLIYGIAGIATGRVTGSSYAFNTNKSYTGTKALVLSCCWVVAGLIDIVAFGGHMLGIPQASFLYDFCMSLLKSG